MNQSYRALLLVAGLLAAGARPGWAQQGQRPATAGHPYASLAGRLQTELRFTTDIAFPRARRARCTEG